MVHLGSLRNRDLPLAGLANHKLSPRVPSCSHCKEAVEIASQHLLQPANPPINIKAQDAGLPQDEES